MNSYICPVKFKSWNIIRKKAIFGTDKNARNIIEKFAIGDILYFHVLSPIKGIVGIAKVKSEMFKDNADIWGKDRYPFRVKIEIIHNLRSSGKMSIPLNILFDKCINEEISIEPYLRNVSIVSISETQSNFLADIFMKEIKKVANST